MEKKRFAVLLCAEDSDYVKKKYGGYFDVFVGMLSEEGETWDVYRVALGEFPDDGEINDYDGFVVTGSCHDAHGNDAWICKLLALLKKLHSLQKKVLGICFGHQILCRSLGGKTGRAINGWDIGLTTINFSPSKSLAALQIPSSLTIIECHRDEVRELPPCAEVMAWSEKTGIEMFKCGDHIMGIQGHPEYTKDILMHLIDRLLQRDLIQSCHVEAAKASLEAYELDEEAWKKLCKSFLKGPSLL
ncbi:gamma-glutamyl peptidase 5-like [Magnolia sinica]|uniref:gamma-glutamyl peptidase 5-like n=1 Tax=Magnolia sinica TaxID=86752 RepID=UPI0026587629|nr:gamma-glutamyl peptidase 5-like [Magnolia sinica]